MFLLPFSKFWPIPAQPSQQAFPNTLMLLKIAKLSQKYLISFPKFSPLLSSQFWHASFNTLSFPKLNKLSQITILILLKIITNSCPTFPASFPKYVNLCQNYLVFLNISEILCQAFGQVFLHSTSLT